jgi:hypothetical protein
MHISISLCTPLLQVGELPYIINLTVPMGTELLNILIIMTPLQYLYYQKA